MKILIFASFIGFVMVTRGYAADAIKIGVVGPRTGPAAATGKAFEEGITLALDVLKASGGVLGRPVEVVFEDTGGVPEKAVAAFEKLATKDKVAIVVGESHSSSALAEIEVSNRYNLPFIVAEAWHDDIMKKGYPSVFRVGPSNSSVVLDCIAKFIEGAKFKKVFILAENTDWGKGIGALTESELKTKHIPYTTLSTDRENKDHYSELAKIKAEKPDLVMAYIYGFGLHSLVLQAKETGVTGLALIMDGAGPPSLWPEFKTNVG
ncbi:MAG: ABC transporter substrate-binding protein, partial [Deltaproteobacteria bacterium]|nr:ABC transporter substrate-binding protein [Deltaproteobacteria bacterium]